MRSISKKQSRKKQRDRLSAKVRKLARGVRERALDCSNTPWAKQLEWPDKLHDRRELFRTLGPDCFAVPDQTDPRYPLCNKERKLSRTGVRAAAGARRRWGGYGSKEFRNALQNLERKVNAKCDGLTKKLR